MKELEYKLIKILDECNKHKNTLQIATTKLNTIMPLDIKRYELLTSDQSSYIDQIIFRFSKLQDTMGEKLFPTILLLLGEDIKPKSFIDRLNRLEELELIDATNWLNLRKDRNEIAHEYSFNQEEVVDSLNIIYNQIPNILNIYTKFYKFSLDKFEFLTDKE